MMWDDGGGMMEEIFGDIGDTDDDAESWDEFGDDACCEEAAGYGDCADDGGSDCADHGEWEENDEMEEEMDGVGSMEDDMDAPERMGDCVMRDEEELNIE
ncbi:MAG: hypothetical protein N2V77_02970 [Canidatus Methanoxibalbensis ujae]|nr:hypothetical protein [Candidatus Methanoxibalbensis ujae]MCW7077614.1 hypothetical protein [Candidatus Methanoxibalbensis ujae]